MQTQTTGEVRGIIANLVTIEVDGPVAQNEICFIHLGNTQLMAEVIKVTGKHASAQVFESTRGLRVGDYVTFAGHMLEVQLGPGLLSSNYDGLQNNLATMEGVFLKKENTPILWTEKKCGISNLWHVPAIPSQPEIGWEKSWKVGWSTASWYPLP